ncbi:MAG: hypothetical protein KA248_09035 [Kiritimatiellae bacterium]|nr:hypothetical protein [Kiritimatiellia bacterium]
MQAFLKKNGALLAALFAAAFLFVLHLRILTYVTAQDPFIYIRLARRLAEASFRPAAVLEVFRWMMPGYPLWLAAAIGIGGPFAPYWVNLPFTIGLFILLVLIARRLYGDGLSLVAMTLFGLWLILAGHALNPHFLLYPFRESPMLFFCLLGSLLALASREKGGSARLFFSGLSFLLAGAMREPALFCVPFAAWAIARAAGRGRRARALGWFLLPFLPAALLWLGMSLARGGWGTAQMSFWVYGWPEGGAWVKLRHAGRAFAVMLAAWVRSAGWWGAALTAIGAADAAWRRREALLLFLAPGLLLLLFYGCHGEHPRYVLEALVLMAPLAMGGVALCARGLERPSGRLFRGRGELAISGLLAVVFLVPCAALLRRAAPWGIRVSRADIRRFREQVRPYEGTNNLVFLDTRCRYLADAFASYTRVRTADPLSAERVRGDSVRMFYADPAGRDAYVATGRDYQGVPPETMLRHYFDVEPAGEAGRVQLGPQVYRMKEVRPWTATRALFPLPANSSVPLLAWLDFQAATQAVKTVALLDERQGVLRSWSLGPAVQLQPIYLDPGEAAAFVSITSGRPFPAGVLRGLDEAGRPRAHDLTRPRPLSLTSWFRPPFVTAGPRHKYGVAFPGAGVLEIPPVAGGEERGLTIQLVYQPDRRAREALRLIYKEGDRELGRGLADLGRREIRHRFRLPPRPEAGPRRIEISADAAWPTGVLLRVTGFGMHLE